MPSTRLTRLLATLIGVAALLTTPTTAQATASRQDALIEVRYNAGDEAPEHGPNSFVVTLNDCSRSRYVEYEWGLNRGHVNPACGETKVVSVAPLGTTEYALRWRICYVAYWRYPPRLHLVCSDYHQDVVLTT